MWLVTMSLCVVHQDLTVASLAVFSKLSLRNQLVALPRTVTAQTVFRTQLQAVPVPKHVHTMQQVVMGLLVWLL